MTPTLAKRRAPAFRPVIAFASILSSTHGDEVLWVNQFIRILALLRLIPCPAPTAMRIRERYTVIDIEICRVDVDNTGISVAPAAGHDSASA